MTGSIALEGIRDLEAFDLEVAALMLGTEFACLPAAVRGTAALRKVIAAGQDSRRVREDMTVTDHCILAATEPLDHSR